MFDVWGKQGRPLCVPTLGHRLHGHFWSLLGWSGGLRCLAPCTCTKACLYGNFCLETHLASGRTDAEAPGRLPGTTPPQKIHLSEVCFNFLHFFLF